MEALVEMYTPEAEERLLGGSPDFVLDAIDNIDTKVRLCWCAGGGLTAVGTVAAAGSTAVEQGTGGPTRQSAAAGGAGQHSIGSGARQQ